MSAYYYLAASLPMLRLDEKPGLTLENFMEACGRLMAPGDFRVLGKASIKDSILDSSENMLLSRWEEMNSGLRNELVKLRARNLDWEADSYLHPDVSNPLLAPTARSLLEEANPQSAEHLLFQTQWHWLDDLQVGHQFDLDYLIVYYLKLQILERKASFAEETGKQKLQSIINGEGTHE